MSLPSPYGLCLWKLKDLRSSMDTPLLPTLRNLKNLKLKYGTSLLPALRNLKEPQGPSRTIMDTSSSHPQVDPLDVSVCGEVRDNEGQFTSTTHTDRKELWFDPWLAAKGDVLKEAVQNTLSFLATMEHRQRARKAQDQRAFERCVEQSL